MAAAFIIQMDKTNLIRRITELDDMVKKLLGAQITQEQVQRKSMKKASLCTLPLVPLNR